MLRSFLVLGLGIGIHMAAYAGKTAPINPHKTTASAKEKEEVEALNRAYDSSEFTQTRSKAIRKLQERGYQIHSIQVQTYESIPVLMIHASKNSARYVLNLTYPDLRIVREYRTDSVQYAKEHKP